MVRKLLIALGVLVALLLLLIATRPDSYTVERSTTVAAPPAIPYGMLQDLHAWDQWSPWAKLDPAMKTTLGGAGVGATYAWEGNDAVGAGKMTIADLKPNEAVGITLEFLRPTAATNRTEFLLVPQEQGTKVTWRMQGQNVGFFDKASTLVMNRDQLIGKDLDRGLGQLRALAEDAAAAEAAKTTAPRPEPTATSPDAADATDAGTP